MTANPTRQLNNEEIRYNNELVGAAIEEKISNMEWRVKNTIQWRSMLMVLKQYRDKLIRDNKLDRVPHLNEFIAELEEVRKR